MSGSRSVEIDADALSKLVSSIFVQHGLSESAANQVARGLVDADAEGLHSHGVMLLEMYVERLRAGSVLTKSRAEIVSDRLGALVLDAGNALGHLTGDQAMEICVERAKKFGVAAVAVRHGFHFGTARRFAVAAAEQDCIGIAMCNTRPLMPAPGGAERVVGNNPLAIAIPTDGDIPIALDMATSEAAMGKIRMAAKSGEQIPKTWAVSSDGSPTTDPQEAIAGMLLPMAGPKGFGLSFVIDLMCGLLSGGAFGKNVQPLYGDPAVPYDCSHFFMAIDISAFVSPAIFRALSAEAAKAIRQGAKAPGIERIYTPGEPEWQRRAHSKDRITLNEDVVRSLEKLAQDAGIDVSVLNQNQASGG